jgi:LysR family transcriptional regulator (chromosome initiation inhibitor)
MKFDRSHLSALAAILREGSFEKAALSLHVTPSAISQRIRALEEQVGAVLIIRDTPCRPTVEGERLYRHALQIDLLERDLLNELSQQASEEEIRMIPVAVSADALATWFVEAVRLFHAETGAMVEAFADNEGHTTEWLREGRVLGAVTSSAKTVQGCRTEKLKPMRYIPMASKDFMKRHFAKGLTLDAFQQAPMLVFDRKDRLQHDFVKQVTGKDLPADPPCHKYPSSNAFQEMAALGLGWGMAPEKLMAPYLKAGTLVTMSPKNILDVPLYWQSWRLTSPTLDAMTRAVKRASSL